MSLTPPSGLLSTYGLASLYALPWILVYAFIFNLCFALKPECEPLQDRGMSSVLMFPRRMALKVKVDWSMGLCQG